MPIRKLNFSFEVPITQLLGLIATGNAGLKIDVIGDDRVGHAPKRINGHAPKLLEGPKRGKNGDHKHPPSWQAMLRALAKHPEHTKAVGELGHLLVGMGLSAKSVSPQLSMMKKKGWVRQVESGVYQMTAKGGVEAQRLGFEVTDRKLKPDAKKTRTQVTEEQGHGE
jgi:hypothetical protein